ncbi:MAG: hypothetical protein U5K30_14000 [Acidimicrobiales bacterium]|nr:hypothetical protein [Acidimicrobiales bacterium]
MAPNHPRTYSSTVVEEDHHPVARVESQLAQVRTDVICGLVDIGVGVLDTFPDHEGLVRSFAGLEVEEGRHRPQVTVRDAQFEGFVGLHDPSPWDLVAEGTGLLCWLSIGRHVTEGSSSTKAGFHPLTGSKVRTPGEPPHESNPGLVVQVDQDHCVRRREILARLPLDHGPGDEMAGRRR